jgi:16S rRNA G966 N2-methylase RsmD
MLLRLLSSRMGRSSQNVEGAEVPYSPPCVLNHINLDFTLDLDPKMIAIALSAFEKFEVTNRVKLIEGPAADTLKTIRGEFDIIFIDADKPGYKTYLQIILDRKMLNKNGIIITDNSMSPSLNLNTMDIGLSIMRCFTSPCIETV